MKRLFAICTMLCALKAVSAQTRTFRWQNVQREYLLFEPSNRTGAVPVMYFLHGLGDNITRCANEMHFDQLAERYGWTIVVPQATSVGGYTMWNAGLGGTSDDAGFLMALLDTLVENGTVNSDSVFFTGFSMGGFMTHRMAIEHGDRITACAPVSGLIAFAFADEAPVEPVRMMHIHGTDDNTVGWNGGSAYFGTIGINVDSIVSYWTSWNVCDETPTVDTLPDRVSDGLRFIRYTYSGDAEFQLLKVVGGTHNWYQDSTRHDIDYFDEIHRFFLGGDSSLGHNDPSEPLPTFNVWPNPATELIDKVRNTYMSELSDEQIGKLKTACYYHTFEESSEDITVDICFDADRLDLLRCGVTPDPLMMASEIGAELAGVLTEAADDYKDVRDLRPYSYDILHNYVYQKYKKTTEQLTSEIK